MNIHYHNVSTWAQEQHKKINQQNARGRKCPFLYDPSSSLSYPPDKISFKYIKCLECNVATFFMYNYVPQFVWNEFHCLKRCNRQIIQRRRE